MIREHDIIFIDNKKQIRNTKSSEEYFKQIKFELKNIEFEKKRLKYSDYSEERKEEIQERLNSDEKFWKKELDVKEKYVFQVLDQLNKEGIVSQPNHIKPHDCFRPNSNGWMDDIYYIRKF